jgi:plasmid stabilization system protein ParE
MNHATVVITETAEGELAEAFAYIRARSPLNAERWVRQILAEVQKLETFAGYGRARESDFLGVELRQKVFKSHRIVFEVTEEKELVIVHYIRHGSRRAAGEREHGPKTRLDDGSGD